MRAYSASSQEARHASDLLKDWAREGFLTEAQYRGMREDTVSDLRRTNIFLRIVLFFFTLVVVGAAVALFFLILISPPRDQSFGFALLLVAAGCYVGAELAVSSAKLYHYGIEEALAVCSVGFLCAALQSALFTSPSYSSKPPAAEFLVPAAGAMAALWIWHRFQLPYAFFAAMNFVVWLPVLLTSSHWAQHLIVALWYATGLLMVVTVRRLYRFTYLNREYSIAEALLWLGVYLAINLQLSPANLGGQWSASRAVSDFSAPFYWTTWLLTWCLPPIVLLRGLRQKDRPVIATGMAVAVVTLITNKSYLGWERHTWDPMLLGALLIGVALFVRRWLAAEPGGVRHGFTAQRLSGKDRVWINVGSTALGLVSPDIVTSGSHAQKADVHFGGGDFGGGGAASDF